MPERVTKDEVRRVLALARLELSDEEIAVLQGELDAILRWVERLNALETEGVPPTFHALEEATRLREDRPEAGLRRSEALRGAARSVEGAFAVPRVVEGE
ncbi:MAG: Asp-tRNA(Asn)/Glu-tRNA(Gln) amidotransferase subunit GatC [Deltaproteobacteria bacterium]|nr:Asp-tRNA(Asn)/Glu-tRNA(Gln) amidotransferase subunit GatC [Deltaproteobacteria bacterium]